MDLSFNPVSDGLPLNDRLDPVGQLALPDVFQLNALVRVVQCSEHLGDSLHARGEVGGFDTLHLFREK